MQRAFLCIAGTMLIAFLAVGPPARASAHERREILDGRYQLIVGWVDEPAISDELNSLDLRVSDLSQATPAADGGQAVGAPVEGLELTLTVDVIFIDQTRTLELEPRWQTPGAYNGYLIPVQPGDYVFHIYGTIGGEAVDEMFIPGPETFSVVNDRAALEFPAATAQSADAPVSGAIGDFGGGRAAGAAGLLALAGVGLALRRRQPQHDRLAPAT